MARRQNDSIESGIPRGGGLVIALIMSLCCWGIGYLIFKGIISLIKLGG